MPQQSQAKKKAPQKAGWSNLKGRINLPAPPQLLPPRLRLVPVPVRTDE